jgi:uncharacterized protein (UPF0303 family)
MSHIEPSYTVEQLETEASFDFPHFTNDDAYDLGTLAAELIREWDLKLAVDIVVGDHHVYRAKLKHSDQASDGWLRKKAAVARDFGASSLLIRYRHDAEGTAFTDREVDHEQYAAYGGAVPIRVDGQIVATITTSGEADVVDHEVAVEAIRRYLTR